MEDKATKEFVRLPRSVVMRLSPAEKEAYKKARARDYFLRHCTALPRTTEDRNCLKCGRNFPSLGPQNRVCEHCNRSNAGHRAVTYKFHAWRG